MAIRRSMRQRCETHELNRVQKIGAFAIVDQGSNRWTNPNESRKQLMTMDLQISVVAGRCSILLQYV